MSKKDEITIVTLFKNLEAMRVLMRLSIEDVAFMIDVTPLAYKNWKNHDSIPQSVREPDFRKIIKRLENRYHKSLKKSNI